MKCEIQWIDPLSGVADTTNDSTYADAYNACREMAGE